jgi:putative membrane protein
MVMALLTAEDHARVTAAVSEAERGTSGEIVTIVAGESDAYHDVGLHYAVLAMLLVPAALAAAPQGLIDWKVSLFLGWNAEPTRGQSMLFLFVVMTVVFLVVRFALAYRPLRIRLTPGATRSRRVHRRAVALFRAGCELKTHRRTGVLIYLSLLEHRAEIVADKAIADQVTPDVWGEAMAALINEVKAGRIGDGMARAVEKVGAVLAPLLPPDADNPNELPDRLVEL